MKILFAFLRGFFLLPVASFIRGWLKRNGSRVAAIAWDLAFLVGCMVFVYGVRLAWRPGGFMVAGLLLIAVAVLFQRQPGKPEGSK